MGSAINRGLKFRMAQTPVQHYLPLLMERIQKGEIDTSFVITHRASLEDGPDLYKTFREKGGEDGCIKVVLNPPEEKPMAYVAKPLAVVTGASTGIGRELARIAAERGNDLVIVANEDRIEEAAQFLRESWRHRRRGECRPCHAGGRRPAVRRDPRHRPPGRPADGQCRRRASATPSSTRTSMPRRRVVDTNITGTVYLIQKIGQEMRRRNAGRILITGSIAGFMPGSFQAVYNGTKRAPELLLLALRNELEGNRHHRNPA